VKTELEGVMATVQADAERHQSYVRDFTRLFPYLRKYKGLALASVSMIGAGSLAALVAPWPLAILLDTVLGNKPLPAILGPVLGGTGTYTLLVFAVLFGLVVTALEHGLAVVDNYVNTKLEQRIILDFRSDLFQHAQRLSFAFHDETAKGTLMFKLSNEADAAGQIVVAIPALIQAVVTVVLMLVISFRIDPVLALISLAVVPCIYCSAGFYTRRIQPRVYHVRNLEGQTLSIIYEAMSMLRVVVSFGREGHEYSRFRTQGETAVGARVGLTVRQTIFSLVVSMITALGTAAVLGIGAYQALHHQLTAGELLVILGYVGAMYRPLEQISGTFTSLQQTFIGFRYALDLLDTEPEIMDTPGAVSLGKVQGRVTFQGVDFAYRERPSTLKDISFDVEPGGQVAIVGPTGAGKTTLVSLMMRFYDPGRGRILLDGHDLRDVTLRSLRDQISVVLQEPLLFSGTIHDNIRYGKLEATEAQVIAAAKAANAHNFIEQLPESYRTTIGEQGARLSGGERQRICVARAFLKDAPVLILDEPTSSIDSKTEAVILDSLDVLMEGRTSFMIAHRLSTVRHAGLILVLNGGRIVERGTHDELMRNAGLYSQLWLHQQGRELRQRADEASRPGVAEERRHLTPEVLSTAALALGAAVSAALKAGSAEPLWALAAQSENPDEAVRLAAGLADAMPDDLGQLEAVWRLLRRFDKAGASPRVYLELVKEKQGGTMQ
jgi:ATP-binding cassette, subfamily B, bacterial